MQALSIQLDALPTKGAAPLPPLSRQTGTSFSSLIESARTSSAGEEAPVEKAPAKSPARAAPDGRAPAKDRADSPAVPGEAPEAPVQDGRTYGAEVPPEPDARTVPSGTDEAFAVPSPEEASSEEKPGKALPLQNGRKSASAPEDEIPLVQGDVVPSQAQAMAAIPYISIDDDGGTASSGAILDDAQISLSMTVAEMQDAPETFSAGDAVLSANQKERSGGGLRLSDARGEELSEAEELSLPASGTADAPLPASEPVSRGERKEAVAERGEERRKAWKDGVLQAKGEEPLSSGEASGVFTVIDGRTKDARVAAAKESLGEQRELRFEQDSHGNAVVTMTLSAAAEQNILSSDAQSASASSSVFQQMLSSQVQVSAPEFVKAANFVLRDGNQGTINMILKPEQLGNVKVSLQLSDKVIAGQITVATKEALEAFKQNLDTLKQAFIQSGFDNATLSLSLADGSAANNGSLAQHQQAGQQFRSERAYGQYVAVADAVEAVPAEGGSFRADGSRYAIDVVA